MEDGYATARSTRAITPLVATAVYAHPVVALGDLLGPAVERMADVIGAPCAMAAQSGSSTTET